MHRLLLRDTFCKSSRTHLPSNAMSFISVAVLYCLWITRFIPYLTCSYWSTVDKLWSPATSLYSFAAFRLMML